VKTALHARRDPRQTMIDWNVKNPPGTPVTRFRLMHPPRDRVGNTVTRSEAWVLNGQITVVKVEGVAGGVAVDSLKVGHDQPEG
jgi:hypothetical protein